VPETTRKISSRQVRADFNDLRAVVHYARAAQRLGLWHSEHAVFAEHLPRPPARILEAGCGAGRVALGLWELGYRNLHAFDFAEELLAQAQTLLHDRGAAGDVTLFHADARRLRQSHVLRDQTFEAVVFMFNGLMQIPGRQNRRKALRQLRGVSEPGAPLIFTTHDRDHSAQERAAWRLETIRWESGTQDPLLVEFGDRYFEDDLGRTFMHLPNRTEILEDLAASGWQHHWDKMRREIAREPKAVRDFSDECRFWVAHAG
jgi:ubiquinone/menaquinone biosynthesis C-methylase UbiE